MKLVRSVGVFSLATVIGCASLSAASADEKGDKILRKAFAKLSIAKSMTADITKTISGEGIPEGGIILKGTVSALKPNYLAVDFRGSFPGGQLRFDFASDGKEYFSYSGSTKQYTKEKVALLPTEFAGMWEGEIDAFFGGEKNALKVKTDYEGAELYNKIPCDIVKVESKTGNIIRTITYTIGKKDSIIYRAVFPEGNPEESSVLHSNVLTNIKWNATKTPADFAFKPPAGATLRKPALPPLDRAELKSSRRARFARR